ncbi:MAG: hypothetical protein Q9168_000324 [Polycauliona sp. 1 TL-2023]
MAEEALVDPDAIAIRTAKETLVQKARWAIALEEVASRMKTMINHEDLIRKKRLNLPSSPPHNELRRKESQQGGNPINSKKAPVMAVTLGSKPDSSVLAPEIKLLEQLEIPVIVTITPAHRTLGEENLPIKVPK